MNDGSYYEGEFDNGEISGSGLRKWTATGNIYEGEFLKGELTGKGTMKYGNGSVYEGEWHENMRQGNYLFPILVNALYALLRKKDKFKES